MAIGTSTTYSPGMVSMTSETPEFNLGGGGAPNQLMALLQRRLERSMAPQQPSIFGRNNSQGGGQRQIRDVSHGVRPDPGEAMYTSYSNIANGQNGPYRASGPGPGAAFGGYAPRGSGVQESSFAGPMGPSRASLPPPPAPQQAAALEQNAGDDWNSMPSWMKTQVLSNNLGKRQG